MDASARGQEANVFGRAAGGTHGNVLLAHIGGHKKRVEDEHCLCSAQSLESELYGHLQPNLLFCEQTWGRVLVLLAAGGPQLHLSNFQMSTGLHVTVGDGVGPLT